MGTLRRAANGLAIALTLAYPIAVYFGLQVLEPRTLGLMLLLIILLRHWRAMSKFASGVGLAEWVAFAMLCGLAATIMLSNDARLLLAYPVAVSLSMLFIFGRSLLYPPTVIERFARLSAPELTPEGVRYTRKVTWVWCGFFVMNAAISGATVFAPREYWALYNGLISYILMGLLFGGEWIVRGVMQRRGTLAPR